MNLPGFALSHRPVVLALTAVVLVVGVFNFLTMPRREDPEIIVREALIITAWPGASSSKVEELVTEPLEDAIGEVGEIEKIRSKSLVGLSVIQATVDDSVRDTDRVWNDLRAKIRDRTPQLPDDSGAPFVNTDFGDVYEIVLAVYQVPLAGEDEIKLAYSPRELERIAERIEDRLQLIKPVAKVNFWGAREERIYIEVDSADWAKINLTARQLRDLFQARNIVEPGGELDTRRGRYAVQTTGEFTSVKEMNNLVVGLHDNILPVRLGDLPLKIDRRYQEPPSSLVRFTSPEHPHQPCLVIGISMKSGSNVIEMGREVDRVLAELEDGVVPPDIHMTRVNDLPRQVNARISELFGNLLLGVLIVLAAALVAMGWRPALIMVTAIPLSMFAALAVVRFMGVELEQFAIASLIISLGMVVDNAIVVSDNVYRHVRAGRAKLDAVRDGAQELAVPILVSTVTTILAFLPMLTVEGNEGDYIRSLPVVVTATLSASYLVAMLITPLMCWWLMEDGRTAGPADGRTVFIYDRVIGWCLRHKTAVLAAAFVTFGASLAILPVIGNQFFPAGARDQFFIKVWLPEGSAISQTARVVEDVERVVLDTSPVTENGSTTHRLANTVAYIGTGGARIMLTQEPEYDYPFYALVIVNTTSPDFTPDFARDVRARLSNRYDARITVERFVLGPPLKDPISFRLSGPDADVLRTMVPEMLRIFKSTAGVEAAYSNWGATAYQVEVDVDSYAANLAGVTNADIALTTKSLLSGALLTTFREGDHKIPVVLRTVRERRGSLGDLSGIFVNGANGKVPLAAVAELRLTWRPAVIAHYNRLRTVTVSARVGEGMLSNTVAEQIQPRLEAIMSTLPVGYTLKQGGEYAATVKTQGQVLRAVLIAVILIVLMLIVQYNSLLKPVIILVAVPMSMIGVLIGLLVTGWAMGFMAMLGALSLAGIVINNAIILIDFIETRISEGDGLHTAVTTAGRVRLRPILLTTVTTMGGLLPLSLFGGPLWAPMTNGMIFGLAFSTVLTLIVVPTLYVTFAERLSMKTA